MKKIIATFATFALVSAMAVPAFADTYKSDQDWTVDFDGSKMNSNFKSLVVDDTLAGLQPGDTMELSIALENKADHATNWYLTNDVLVNMAESQEAAQIGGYTYRLAYLAPDGTETVIYDDEAVAGEGQTFKDALAALGDYTYLGQMAPSEKGQMNLVVGLDGETQGNGYQDSMADLQMRFATERATTTGTTVPDANTGTNTSTNTSTPDNTATGTNTSVDNPPAQAQQVTAPEPSQLHTMAVTGDSLLPAWLLGGAAVLGIVLLLIAVIGRRKSREEE